MNLSGAKRSLSCGHASARQSITSGGKKINELFGVSGMLFLKNRPCEYARLQTRETCGYARLANTACVAARVMPNPSFNLRANGMPQSPRHSAGVHFLYRGLCVIPSYLG